MSDAQERLAFVLTMRGACPDALEWVRDYDLPTMEAYWAACPDARWLCWLARRVTGMSTLCICRYGDAHADATREEFPFNEALRALGLR